MADADPAAWTRRDFNPGMMAAEMPAPFEALHGASKAFLLSFAEVMRNELKDTIVTITALQPGAARSETVVREVAGTHVSIDSVNRPTRLPSRLVPTR